MKNTNIWKNNPMSYDELVRKNQALNKRIEELVSELENYFIEVKSNVTEDIIIVGDFNAHIGNDEEGVKDNHEKVGVNGEEYRRFIRRACAC